MIYIALTSHFGWVLLAAAALAMECVLIGMLLAGSARRKTFTEDFLKRNFEQEHTAATGEPISAGGYPDMGSGWYSRKLPYLSWWNFNNAQRAHYNFVETIAATTLLLIVGGLYQPLIAAATGLAVIIGRLAFALGYTYGGPSGRLIGGIIVDLGYLVLMVLACMSCYKMIHGANIG